MAKDFDLSFGQVHKLIKLIYKPFKEWEAFKSKIIDEEGNILKPNELNWAEIVIRNIKLLLLQNTIIKGSWGQDIFDKNIYRYIRFLKESKELNINLYEPLSEKEILRIVINKKTNKLFN